VDEVRFIAAAGGLGSVGIHAPSLEAALEHKPHFIATDAGTTDSGPHYLGTGTASYSRESIKNDLALLLKAGRKAGAPVIIGSAGTAGGDNQVDWVFDILREAASEAGGKTRAAVIYAEQDKTYLKDMLRQNRIRPLDPAPPFDEGTIDRSTHIVGMMGVEQLQGALQGGADFVLAGRCSDSAIYAAWPIMHGMPQGLSWHAGKIVECGTLVCETRGKGVVLGRITKDDFLVTPIGAGLRCTPQSVAAHSLYENADPYLHKECSGTLDLTRSVFEQAGDVSVRVTGSEFIPADDYTVKLEGAELAGYQTVMIGGIRDPFMIARLDTWLAEVRQEVENRISRLFGNEVQKKDYHMLFHVYGRDAVMGKLEPNRNVVPNEVGLVLEITAPTQQLASKFVSLSRQPLLHHPIPEWKGAITGFAMLHSPGYIERGPVYRFNVHHVVVPRTPMEMFRTKFVELG
jgi:hypothetical protein